jgi:hypothetical protein
MIESLRQLSIRESCLPYHPRWYPADPPCTPQTRQSQVLRNHRYPHQWHSPSTASQYPPPPVLQVDRYPAQHPPTAHKISARPVMIARCLVLSNHQISHQIDKERHLSVPDWAKLSAIPACKDDPANILLKGFPPRHLALRKSCLRSPKLSDAHLAAPHLSTALERTLMEHPLSHPRMTFRLAQPHRLQKVQMVHTEQSRAVWAIHLPARPQEEVKMARPRLSDHILLYRQYLDSTRHKTRATTYRPPPQLSVS